MGKNRRKHRTVILESRPSAIDGLFRDITVEMKANGYGEEDIFAVHLAVEEAFINAVRHGNRMDPQKSTRIEYSVDSRKISVSLTDEGEGFDPEAVPDPRNGENLLKTSGRGLLLISSYMDEVRFNDRGNRVQMTKYKAAV